MFKLRSSAPPIAVSVAVLLPGVLAVWVIRPVLESSQNGYGSAAAGAI